MTDISFMSDSWAIYNSKTKEMREKVTLEELRALLQSLTAEDQRFWFAWNGRRDSWEPALDIVYEMTRPSLNAKNHDPINSKNFVEMQYEVDEATRIPTIDLSEPENQVISITRAQPAEIQINSEPPPQAKSGFDRRRYPRYHARFRVIIKNENLTFRTFSLDVSLGGLAIETAVPPGCIGSTCQVLLGHPTTGENISFSARLLNSRPESKYFSFVKSPQESLSRLQKWLISCEPLKRAN